MPTPITQEQLKEILHYSPESGLFTWRKRVANCIQIGDVAGGLTAYGYIRIRINCEMYNAHRLAFLYMEGAMPPDQVDHINRVRDDNRWENLRHATAFDNHLNMKTNVPFFGVYWHKRDKVWQVLHTTNGIRQYIGSFKTNLAACYCKWVLEDL